METKKCSKCGEEKLLSEFYILKTGKIATPCKKCKIQYSVEWGKKNKEKRKQYHGKWSAKNKDFFKRKYAENEEFRKKILEYNKNWIRQNTEKRKEHCRKSYYKNHEKTKAQKRRHYKENAEEIYSRHVNKMKTDLEYREKRKKTLKKYTDAQSAELTDWYIKNVLARHTDFKQSEIDPTWIRNKRIEIKAIRAVNEFKAKINESGQ